jgi:hypothetical protein
MERSEDQRHGINQDQLLAVRRFGQVFPPKSNLIAHSTLSLYRINAAQRTSRFSLLRQLPCSNYLYFQWNSRMKWLSVFVFIDIPALLASFPRRSFVFIDIPGSFLQIRSAHL